jgi:5-methylcytosine-specific restriction endonuclease McrA
MQKQCSKCKELKDVSQFHKWRYSNDGYKYECKECRKKETATYRDKHSEAIKTRKHNYRALNKDKIRLGNKRYFQQAYYQDKDRFREQVRSWRRRNPDKRLIQCKRRHAHRKGATGKHTAKEWRLLCQKYNYQCLRCGRQKPLTEDHIIPLSKGGADSIDNIQPLCVSCNSWKRDKTIDYRTQYSKLPEVEQLSFF